MNTKSSAHYQREYRKRLREQGLVKKEVWVLPEHARTLAYIEKKLRVPGIGTMSTGELTMTDALIPWTTKTLLKALVKQEPFSTGLASVELIEGIDPSLHIIMKEYGDLPVFLTVAGDQIIVESVLWSVKDVIDTKEFNEVILRTHKYFPLSTISLDHVGASGDYYHMFGALSATSLIDNVLFEIEILANNVIQATEAYGEFLTLTTAAN